jgi:hypothetical protein
MMCPVKKVSSKMSKEEAVEEAIKTSLINFSVVEVDSINNNKAVKNMKTFSKIQMLSSSIYRLFFNSTEERKFGPSCFTMSLKKTVEL